MRPARLARRRNKTFHSKLGGTDGCSVHIQNKQLFQANELKSKKRDHGYAGSSLRNSYAGRELRIFLRMVDEKVEDEPKYGRYE